jgi:hypothetical protein
MNDDIQWAARLEHVREVSLVGSADLAFWIERLLAEGLTPRPDANGRAQLLVIAAAARFMGIPFREVSFSIVVEPPAGAERPDASFLLRAYNSRRFFAWCERVFFATPYHRGDIRDVSTSPATMHLVAPREGEFRAQMHTDSTATTRNHSPTAEKGWQGPVYLPTNGRNRTRAAAESGLWFFAELRGQTHSFPFVENVDLLRIDPNPDSVVLRHFIDSGFKPTEWLVRPDAFHAKSKTSKRASPILRR